MKFFSFEIELVTIILDRIIKHHMSDTYRPGYKNRTLLAAVSGFALFHTKFEMLSPLASRTAVFEAVGVKARLHNQSLPHRDERFVSSKAVAIMDYLAACCT